MNKKYFNNFTFNYGKNFFIPPGVITRENDYEIFITGSTGTYITSIDPATGVINFPTVTRPIYPIYWTAGSTNLTFEIALNNPLISEIPLFKIPFDFKYELGDSKVYVHQQITNLDL